MKICYSGGGTLGSVTPLLAIHETIQKEFSGSTALWVGTVDGPEKELIETYGIPFVSLRSGKLRRYLSLENITDIGHVVGGFFDARTLLKRERPDICVSAGGFVSVPLHIAAWTLGIPTWVHQQDVQTGLANQIMARFARKVTTALERSVSMFPKRKTEWLGNPLRNEVWQGDITRARTLFGLSGTKPVVFATGGGTGALRINQIIREAVPQLEDVCEIVHVTGSDPSRNPSSEAEQQFTHYHSYPFFTDEMKDAYAVADVIISRGGFGTITEIAAIKKPAILIPKPGHQEENVRFLADAGAVVLLHEDVSDGNLLTRKIEELLGDAALRADMTNKCAELLPIAQPKHIVQIVESLIARSR